MRSSLLGGLILGAACLPCFVLLLIAAGIGAGALSALGTWISSNGLMLGAAAVVFGAVGWIIYARRARTAACNIDLQEAPQVSEGSKT